MTNSSEFVEPDRIEGAPHPREAARIIGQDGAVSGFLDAYNSGRLHHAWLLTGPRGVGKATLAWALAKFLLATPEDEGPGLFGDPEPAPDRIDIDPDHPVVRRIMAGSEPGLKLIRRGGAGANEREREKAWSEGRFSQEIRIHEIRELSRFAHLSATEGGRRVVIVDSADDMNTQAANGLLKLLEEPPARTMFFLVSHQPSRLLPTIRSRCRELRLSPLGGEDMRIALEQVLTDGPEMSDALVALSAGSVGEAVRLLKLDGPGNYAALIDLFAELPRMNRAHALRIAEGVAVRGEETRLDLLTGLIELFLARLAKTGAIGKAPMPEAAPGEADLMKRLAPDMRKAREWAELADALGVRLRHGRAVNLDPAALILDTVFRIQETGGR
ncbi:DNA polymerase III subunit delta' [Aquicoccus sp.]|uniref:DNA polymerase III subunit delta' n=1 Tax=Aquicoccus sp. TaxID=2055851 RepID=UPI0035616EB9